ncbi:transcriptional regulator [Actinotalea sp. M2MS4P-6]|uniref:sugar-binding transcriptional regulator n=1 Tax=Actinotalea sp. M2MS4P-6 TaxID=2983762 RepID=UPI0021E3F783|nr:sugar-binding domain-containing protein [Actinotalea sp. M2MS4P-6]MCV2395132.1 transcriptional regulator [Actinotalea sp. M2MS4P-6]
MSAQRGVGRDHDSLLVDVSRRYHFDGMSMVDIAGELEISRFRVARLLDEAKRRGVVRITLHRPLEGESALAVRLRERYGLRHAVVVRAGAVPEAQLRQMLGREAARLLARLLADGDVLGVGWGRAVKAVADAAPTLARCPVVQLSGITGRPGDNSSELVRLFSSLTGEPAFPLYAPLVLPDAATARALRTSHGIAETFARFRDVSVALVAVGSWDPPNSQLRQYVSPADRDLLTRCGLQAELGGIFLGQDGEELDTPLARRVISISASDLSAVPTVVAVAGHVSKVRAIRAVLKGGYVSALVTDSTVARRLTAD